LPTRIKNNTFHCHNAFKILEDLTELDLVDGYRFKDQREVKKKQEISSEILLNEGRADKQHMDHFLFDFQKKFSVESSKNNSKKRAQEDHENERENKRARKL